MSGVDMENFELHRGLKMYNSEAEKRQAKVGEYAEPILDTDDDSWSSGSNQPDVHDTYDNYDENDPSDDHEFDDEGDEDNLGEGSDQDDDETVLGSFDQNPVAQEEMEQNIALGNDEYDDRFYRDDSFDCD